MLRNFHAFIFDAYGTLLDVHSVVRNSAAGLAGDLDTFSGLWRQRQLERTWLLALMERYEDFREVTESALRVAARQLRIELTGEQAERLMGAYLAPDVFPEVKAALTALGGVPLAILSNGTPEMIETAVVRGGLGSFFHPGHIISVDRVKTYKPSPRVYALGPEILNVPAAETLFVSSNAWDAAGAKAYGYRVCWCNRSGAEPDDLGFAPDFTVTRLDQLTR